MAGQEIIKFVVVVVVWRGRGGKGKGGGFFFLSSVYECR